MSVRVRLPSSLQPGRDAPAVTGRISPHLVLLQPKGDQTEEHARACTDWMDANTVPLRHKYVTIFDLSAVEKVSPLNRKHWTDWADRTKHLWGDYTVGVAYVLKSRIARGVITAIYWMFSPPYVYKIHADLGSAVDWARDLLASMRPDVPNTDALLAELAAAPIGFTFGESADLDSTG